MRKFYSCGRRWNVRIDAAAIQRIREGMDIDLEADPDPAAAVAQLQKLLDCPGAVVQLVWFVIQPRAAEKNITPEEFGRSMVHDLVDAADAVITEIREWIFNRKEVSNG